VLAVEWHNVVTVICFLFIFNTFVSLSSDSGFARISLNNSGNHSHETFIFSIRPSGGS